MCLKCFVTTVLSSKHVNSQTAADQEHRRTFYIPLRNPSILKINTLAFGKAHVLNVNTI